MTTVLVVGLGEVGLRTARQLLDTPAVSRVLVADRQVSRAEEVARALQDGAEAVELDVRGPLPAGVDAIAAAVPSDADAALASLALAWRVPYASSADHDAAIRGLLERDGEARRAGVRLVAGCGLAPGLSDVLARHAVAAFDTADEVHVARFGVAGPASVAEARRAHREPALEWRDGVLHHDKHGGPELVWFPDPVGGRECEPVATGVGTIVAAEPGLARVTARLGAPAARRFGPPRRDPGGGMGAVRVEVWGWRGQARESVVYGVIERTAVAAGTVLGMTAAWLAGGLPEVGDPAPPGASGLAGAVKPVPFLAELARRGVKAATFEGVALI